MLSLPIIITIVLYALAVSLDAQNDWQEQQSKVQTSNQRKHVTDWNGPLSPMLDDEDSRHHTLQSGFEKAQHFTTTTVSNLNHSLSVLSRPSSATTTTTVRAAPDESYFYANNDNNISSIAHTHRRRESGDVDDADEDTTMMEENEGSHKQKKRQPNSRSRMANGNKLSNPEFIYPLEEGEIVDENRASNRLIQNEQQPNDDENAPSSSSTFQVATVPLMRLTKDILAPGRYDVRVRPVSDHSRPLKIHISMSLYQIIEVNEPSQHIKMNVWMIQKWRDEMLHWDPREYDMINSTILPHEVLWIPDTYLYNSVVMNPDETERYMNIRADSLYWEGEQGANMSFLYPAIYTVTCRLNIRYFPYDQQNCTLTISSWTNSKSALDYYADPQVNLASFISNEEWDVMSFRIFRHEYKYACCPEPWVILEASIVIRRKPLYYVINLIIPTSIITLVAITGFFTPASTADDRTEKINLGITTLLAMSILMLMVSDQMPTTSEFVPLIAWFYLSIIIIISIGTFLTSVILSIQGRRQYGQLPALWIRHLFFVKFTKWLWLTVPPPLLTLWEEMDDHPAVTAQRKLEAEGKGRGKHIVPQSTGDNGTTLATQMPPTEHQSQKQQKLRQSLNRRDGTMMGSSKKADGTAANMMNSNNNNMPKFEMEDVQQKRDKFQLQNMRGLSVPGPGMMILSSPISEIGPEWIDEAAEQQQSQKQHKAESSGKPRAKRNWLRVSSVISRHSAQSNQTGGTISISPSPSPRSSQPDFSIGALPMPKRSLPPPPALQFTTTIGSSRRSSGAASNWDQAIGGLGVVTPRKPSFLPRDSIASGHSKLLANKTVSAEVNSMKLKRQCSLEWELLATILDRLFLIIFSMTTIIVTLGVMFTGWVAQWQYEQAAHELAG